jgi:D-arabinonate dehydratase
MCKFINSVLRDELIGQDPFMIELLWKKMYKQVSMISPYDRETRRIVIQSISCVDVSLHDLVGKALGIPVFKLLGGAREKVPLVQVHYYQKADNFREQIEGLRRATSNAKRNDLIGIKLKVGALPINQDVERIKAVREEAGEEFVICVDANHAWTVDEAIKFGGLVEDQSISYLEQPVRIFDEKRDLRKVRETLNIPISACQSFYTRVECMDFVTYGSVDMINPDILKIGGMTEWKKIANMADYYNVYMTACANIEATLPLFGGIYNTTWATQQTSVREPFWSGGKLVKTIPKPVNGYVKLPDVAGIGYEIRDEAIEKHKIPSS